VSARFENFSRSNTDAKLIVPPDAPSDRWSAELKRSSLFPYLFFSEGHDGMKPVLLQCLALGLLSGVLVCEREREGWSVCECVDAGDSDYYTQKKGWERGEGGRRKE